MSGTLVIVLIAGLSLGAGVWIKRRRDRRQLELRSITPEALYALMNSKQKVLLYDVRQPLDLLANSEIIPGAQRLDPKEVLSNPSLISREEDSIVYCTCPSDRTSRAVSERARSERYLHVKFLKGGFAAWKAKGYPVEPYDKPFRLDTGS